MTTRIPASSARRPKGWTLTALGLMSGTSLDGIDAAILRTDGERVSWLGPTATYPYDKRFRRQLRELLGQELAPFAGDVIRGLTARHAEAVTRLLADHALQADALDLIGFHGHTVLHRPEAGRTVQIGDGQLLADFTGVPAVNDFRGADVRAGGQGAPLVPLYHAALARGLKKPLAILNIGGVANVTWLGPREPGRDDPIVAFDTGPGNALIDDWARATTGQPMDEDGHLAASGRVHEDRIAGWLRHAYFSKSPPKSLDRDAFSFALEAVAGLSAEDGAATLAAFTARTVAEARRLLPASPTRWLVTGGGRHHPVLMARLRDSLGVPVEPVEAAGWRGDALEAEAFAFLAVRSVLNLPLSLPSTTGVGAPQTGGVLHRPASTPRRSGRWQHRDR